jgi:hypothetical protein
VLTGSQVAPFAFTPHLKPLADQIAVMWESGQLREGERVMLWEGGVSGKMWDVILAGRIWACASCMADTVMTLHAV